MSTVRRPQQTIARDAGVRGISFLEGRDVQVRFRPAQADAGIVFVRSDLPNHPSVPAHVKHTIPRQRRTTLQRGPAIVEMVEHVMAALAGLRIDNCVGRDRRSRKLPGCDGSSQAFVEALDRAPATVEQAASSRDVLVIDRPITVREGDSILTAYPGRPRPAGPVVSISTTEPGILRSAVNRYFVDVAPESFQSKNWPRARTFLAGSRSRNPPESRGSGREPPNATSLILRSGTA